MCFKKMLERPQSVSWIVILFYLSFSSSSSWESELSEFSGFSSAPCSQFIGIIWRSHLSNCLCQLTDLLHLTFGVFLLVGTHRRSKGLLQNFCQSTEHCLIAFDDIPSCKRIRGGISWLAIRRNSLFLWILCVGHDWCGFCRLIYYLSWAAVKTFCWFTGKAVKWIFWNSSRTHLLCSHSRLQLKVIMISVVLLLK